MDLETQSKTTGDDDRSWMAVERPDREMKTGQLDGSDFTGTFTDGKIPSGTPIGLLSGGGGLYGLYDNSDPAAFVGFTGRAVQVINEAGSTHDVVVAIFDHGIVIEAKLGTYWVTTIAGAAVTAAKTDNPHIQYR